MYLAVLLALAALAPRVAAGQAPAVDSLRVTATMRTRSGTQAFISGPGLARRSPCAALATVGTCTVFLPRATAGRYRVEIVAADNVHTDHQFDLRGNESSIDLEARPFSTSIWISRVVPRRGEIEWDGETLYFRNGGRPLAMTTVGGAVVASFEQLDEQGHWHERPLAPSRPAGELPTLDSIRLRRDERVQLAIPREQLPRSPGRYRIVVRVHERERLLRSGAALVERDLVVREFAIDPAGMMRW